MELALAASRGDAEEVTRERGRLLARCEELEGERTARISQARKKTRQREEGGGNKLQHVQENHMNNNKINNCLNT